MSHDVRPAWGTPLAYCEWYCGVCHGPRCDGPGPTRCDIDGARSSCAAPPTSRPADPTVRFGDKVVEVIPVWYTVGTLELVVEDGEAVGCGCSPLSGTVPP